jgi:DNA repair exonuclease SbcCD nuclease subunit
MRFAHIGDCHLGGWRQPELQTLNLESFRYVVDRAIREQLDFMLIAGDLFDTAYPSIETIKESFFEFKRLKEAKIPVFLIAGSHDYSASGKSFLEVLEKSGFAKNVFNAEERNGYIYLNPTILKNVAIYGYPGKKSGLEVGDINRLKLNDAPGLFKILMLHTTLRDAVGSLPIPAVDQEKLPKVDYCALAHLHITYNKQGRVYCGPLFPNNSLELEELKEGSFYLVDTNGKIQRESIQLKEICIIDKEISDAHEANEELLDQIKKTEVKNKIVIIRLRGFLKNGKLTDIDLNSVEAIARKNGAYSVLRNTSKLESRDPEFKFELGQESLEQVIIRKFKEENPHANNRFIEPLLLALQVEKKEDEKNQYFDSRLFEEIKKVLEL